MNIKLIDSLITIIDSLSQEERKLLRSKIDSINHQTETDTRVETKVEKLFKPTLDEYINITRDERNAQQDELIKSCFGGNNDQ